MSSDLAEPRAAARILPRAAWALAAATWVLILVGGLVHGTGSGLACPDWPLCFGSPVPNMTGHVLFEHSHRLVAGAVGLGTLALAVAIGWRRREHRKLVVVGLLGLAHVLVLLFAGLAIVLKLRGNAGWQHVTTSMLLVTTALALAVFAVAALAARQKGEAARLVALGIGAVGLVLVQAILGGLTVRLHLPAIVSSAHLGVSMLFFALTIVLARALERETGADPPLPVAGATRVVVTVAAVAVYLQLLLGALVRHTGSGLGCIDFPLCNGSLLPLGAPSATLQAVHRLFAVAVAVVLLVAAWRLARDGRRAAPSTARTRVLALAVLLPLLVVGQITLGAFSVLSYLELYTVTAHLGVGALVWATTLLAWLDTRRAA